MLTVLLECILNCLAPCLFQGTCVSLNTTINNFRCACPVGHTGLFCELLTGVCAAEPCGNSRCVLSQYTKTHFTCVTTSYTIEIKKDVSLNKLLFDSDQQWNLQSNINVIHQLEIILRYFLQNIEVTVHYKCRFDIQSLFMLFL